MDEETALDRTHAAMQNAQDDARARLKFFETLAATELFLMLEKESDGDQATPEIFDVSGTSYVLVFDREERLAQFAGRSVPYVAMSGRVLSGMLTENGLGAAVNPDVAPSSILIPPDAIEWLAETLAPVPEEVSTDIDEFSPPDGLPENLLTALDARLAAAAGLAELAYLVAVRYRDGRQGHLLGIIDALPHAETGLAQAVSDALAFSGLDAAALDVGFFESDNMVAARLAKTGLRFDLPQVQQSNRAPQTAPGRDPDNPPKLK